MNDIRIYLEGKVAILAPDLEKYRRGKHLEPAWAPVFYNPRMRLSRDISVSLINAFCLYTNRREISLVEPLSATGIRGLRYVKESYCVDKVYLNDYNSLAYKLILKNVKINKLYDKIKVYNKDANALMYDLNEKVDVIDLDPFGSPAYFILSALKRIKHGGMICATATDLPPLLGIYPNVAWKRYFAKSLRTEFSKEIGVRILVGYIAREAMRLRKGIIPLFIHATDHYIRVCVRVKDSPGFASSLIKKVGYIIYCPVCLFRGIVSNIENKSYKCPVCHKNIQYSGPLWIGKLWDEKFVDIVYNQYLSYDYFDKRGIKIIELIKEEVKAPFSYYKSDVIARKYKLKKEFSPSFIIEVLRDIDRSVSRTHFDPKGFRTFVHPSFIVDILKKS